MHTNPAAPATQVSNPRHLFTPTRSFFRCYHAPSYRGQVMDGSGKIALGIVAAAALLLVGFIGYREFERQRDIAQAQEIMQGLTDYAQQALQQDQRQRAIDSRRRAEAQQRALDARRLAFNERCVGGTVITVEGASYTQALGPDGRPVACSGQFRR